MARINVQSEMTENDLLDELTKELKLEERLPGDVSAYDLSKKIGVSRKRCADILNEKVEKGLLKKIEVRSDTNHPAFVYRKVLNS